MIELGAVRFAYATRLVFDALSVVVARGELVGVLGPNGAGKSTLVRLALGLLPPQAGTVSVGGADLATLSRREIARRVAALVQDEAIGFPMSVKDAVLLGRVAHLPGHGFEASADLAAAEQAMAEVGVMHLADRPLHTLSGGERRRVLCARTLAQGTDALVFDEPAANLDLAHQLELFALLARRARSGAAVLVTVHDLGLAARCDRIVMLDGSGGVAVGTPMEVLTAERLRQVFSVDVEIGRTAAGTPYFIASLPGDQGSVS